MCLLHLIGGASSCTPGDLKDGLSTRAADLMKRAFDYPLPAINIVISTRKLAKNGYLTREERGWLNEIYDYNPLLFDFVLKRTMRVPGAQQRLPASVFMVNPGLGV